MEQLTFIIHVAACLVSSSAPLARVVDLTACTLLNLTHPRAEWSFENPGAAGLRSPRGRGTGDVLCCAELQTSFIKMLAAV